MAASSSVANEIGLRKGAGHISVTKMATARASGTAITRASMEETIVPKINGRAPNSPATGSQALVAKKWNPNFCQARAERCSSSIKISPTTARTERAASNIKPLKPASMLKTDLPHAGAFCAEFAREILCDSEELMDFVVLGPEA